MTHLISSSGPRRAILDIVIVKCVCRSPSSVFFNLSRNEWVIAV